jgi:hypothetical protein
MSRSFRSLHHRTRPRQETDSTATEQEGDHG